MERLRVALPLLHGPCMGSTVIPKSQSVGMAHDIGSMWSRKRGGE